MSPSLSDYRRLSVLREQRQINFIRAALVGLLAGLLTLLFQLAVDKGEQLRDRLLQMLAGTPLPGWLVFALFSAALGGLAAFITVRLAPEATGSGIPHIKAVLLHLRPINWVRVIPVKFLCGWLALTAGFSLGREGPCVQMGGAVGAAFAQFLKVPRRAHAHLIACGSGAGLAAVFNAPLAGFIFVIEELRRELSPLTYGTALIAAVIADLVTRISVGPHPAFFLPELSPPGLGILPMAVLIGCAGGLMGALFSTMLLRVVSDVPKLRATVPRWLRAAMIGAIVGVCGWLLPQSLGTGSVLVEQYLSQGIAAPVGMLLALFAAKFVLTILCYCAGVPGGIFGPVLALGALLGLIGAQISSAFVDPSPQYAAQLGAMGMAGVFAAVVRAPLTGVILIVELTGNYNLLFALMVASLSSYLVTELLRTRPIYEELLQLNLRLRGPKESTSLEPVLIDLVVEPHSAMDGSAVGKLDLPDGCLLVTVKKGGTESVPRASTILRAGDELTVVIDGKKASAAGLVRSFAVAP